MIDTDTSNALSFQMAAGAANVSITFNGSTTGVMGSAITIVATGTDEWTVVDSEVLHTGDVANPFGTSWYILIPHQQALKSHNYKTGIFVNL